MVRHSAWMVGAALLSACASHPLPIVAAAPRVTLAATSSTPTPINAGLTPAATLWHLRAGLNVAALACRGPGEAALIARYNALLAAHPAAFGAATAAHQTEYQTDGGDWRDRYDDDQTRLYNFFSQARGRAALCSSAATALATLGTADDTTLAAAAPAELAALDRAFAPPWLEVDARVFSGPTTVMMASR